MKPKLFFCADIGTSSLKAALIDNRGTLYAFNRIPYENDSAESWLNAFYAALAELAVNNPLSIPVSALVVSGGGPTLVPVSGLDPQKTVSFKPLYWHDNDPMYSGSSLFLSKVKHFEQSNPDFFSETVAFFSPQEWLLWKLGARAVTVIPHKGYVPYYWDTEQCKALAINYDLFPLFVTMEEVIGEFSTKAYERAPFDNKSLVSKLLPPGTPLIAGAADFIMTLIGTDTLEPGKACDRTGSSEGINLCAKNPPFEKIFGDIRCLPYPIESLWNEGLWNLGVVIPKSGTLFDEYRMSSGNNDKSYGELTTEILENNEHPGRAVLDEMAHNFIAALERFKLNGYPIKELTLSGGQCADSRWNKYKAVFSGCVLSVPEIIHAELAGNAVLAAAVLEGKTVPEKAAVMIRVNDVYVPH